MHVINTFCWITYTYSIPGMQYKKVGTEVAGHGLGNENGEEKRYHSYYQWVPFILFLQVRMQHKHKQIMTYLLNVLLGYYVLYPTLDLEELGEWKSEDSH